MTSTSAATATTTISRLASNVELSPADIEATGMAAATSQDRTKNATSAPFLHP
ncbi:MAG: hypothetical protein WAX14_05555 [Rhodococcus sp. (in: high G+C Gram-positive bacteria)]|uniref:hypothetical protein n=1 Tax=Rhodococcus sp. TaxID=1831 RepID=UPI003BB716D6